MLASISYELAIMARSVSLRAAAGGNDAQANISNPVILP